MSDEAVMTSTADYDFRAQWCQQTPHSGASWSRKQLSNWYPARMPADLDLLPDLSTLVARSRDLDRNNGVAAGALQTLQDNVAGTGLRLAACPDYRALGQTIDWAEEWSRDVESLWKTFANCTACDVAGELNFAEMTQLVFRSALENGEAIALPLWLQRPESQFKTCLQLVESDRLRNPWGTENFWGIGPVPNLIAGIEKDAYGRPLAYWIQKYPIYLNGWMLQMPINVYDFERIPAETVWGRKQVLHMHVKERIGQSRGRPILTPVIEQFRMLDSYQRTELQSAIVNALVAGTIETPMDPASLAEMMGGDPAGYLAAKNEYRVQLEGGTFIPLYPGDRMQPFTPARPAAQFSAFVEAISRQIGVSMGLPYELLIKDFSKTNYSSARAALLEAWRFFSVRRAWLAANWAGPVYRLWLEEVVNAGLIKAPNFYENQAYYSQSKWIGMGKGWVDPVKEAEAAQLRMQSMLSTLEKECAEQGEDWNEVIEQRALENKRLEALGLTIPAITVLGAKQSEPPAGEEADSAVPAAPEPAPAPAPAAPKRGATAK